MRNLGRWLLSGAIVALTPVALAQDGDVDEVIEGADLDSMSGEQIKRAISEQGRPQQGPPEQGTAGREQGTPTGREQGTPAGREQRRQQQGPPRQEGLPGDEDLDDVIDAVRDQQQAIPEETSVRPTTPDAGREIQDAVDAEVTPLARQITEEQQEWSRLSPEEQQRRLDEARRSLREFADRVGREDASYADTLRRVAESSDGTVAPTGSLGYGSPLRPVRSYDPSGETGLGGNGEGQARWWEKLLATVVEGVAGGMRGYVATVRANELKARADRLALRAGIENRPYADARVRAAVEASGLSRMGYDKRLDDLLLGGHRSGSGGGLRAEPATPVTDVSIPRGPSKPIPRLPRVRDPITGAEKVMINMPLGADAVQPLVPVVRPR